jgi:hypothetical protein
MVPSAEPEKLIGAVAWVREVPSRSPAQCGSGNIREPEPAPNSSCRRKSAKRVPPAPHAPPSTAVGASSLAPGAAAASRNIVSMSGSSTATSPMSAAARPTLRDGSHPTVASPLAYRRNGQGRLSRSPWGTLMIPVWLSWIACAAAILLAWFGYTACGPIR